MQAPTRRLWPLLCTFGALSFCLSWFWLSPEVSSPNERTRIFLAHSLADRGSLQIDEEVQRWGKVFDISHKDGHFYTDKAPGSSILAIPVVAVLSGIDSDVSIEFLVVWVRHLVVLPVVLLGLLALWRTLALLGVSGPMQALCVLGLGLSTSLFHYSHAFFGHGLVLAASLWAFWGVVEALSSEQKAGRAALVWAGFACGFAFLVEYQAVLLTVALAGGLLSDKTTRSPRFWGWMVLGGAAPVLLALAYNAAAFGHPLSTSYDFLYHAKSIKLHSVGVGGVTVPSLDAVLGLLFSPSRGLLFGAPLVFLGVWWGRGAGPRWLRVSALVLAALYFYVASSVGIWYGGWGFGARLLIPMMGGAFLLLGLGAEERKDLFSRALLVALLACGAWHNLWVTAVFAEPSEKIAHPAKTLGWPLIREGVSAPNWISSLAGEGVLWSFVPAFLVAGAAVVWASSRVLGQDRRGWLRVVIVGLAWWGLLWSQPETLDKRQADKSRAWVKGLRVIEKR